MRLTAIILLIIPLRLFSQDPAGWQHMDPYTDSIVGISTAKAYEYLKGRLPDTVIVAIIDNGADITHKEFSGSLWVNKNEIEGNNTDDDGNGYVDDIHGWNFLGNSGGKNIGQETLEMTRLYAELDPVYGKADTTGLDSLQKKEYHFYRQVKNDYEKEFTEKSQELELYQDIYSQFTSSDSIIKRFLKKDSYTGKKLQKIKSKNIEVMTAREFLLKIYALDLDTAELLKEIANLKSEFFTRLNPMFRTREEIINDDPANLNDTIYGNNMVYAMGPSHGTGVTGIIGGRRDSSGVDGIVNAVKFMVLRVVPDGDERDKDVALAIRYAVKNGAQIINCSFGKKYSANPEFVNAAVEEAERHDVLIVHAAGNDNENVDIVTHFPSGLRNDGTPASNFITVGASAFKDDEKLIASFSNYGKNSVDIFAPGYRIMTSTLNNAYSSGSGTSFSAPVVSGVAAVLRSYFPELTAPEIKEIIMKSAYIPKTQKLTVPGTNIKAAMKDLCVSGGVVNLYNSVKMADEWNSR
jgi:cell wall-associated protease